MEKKFDAIEMTRKIRDKLISIYKQDPKKEIEELEEIRKKYGIKEKVKNT